MYLFIPEIYNNLIESPSFNLQFWRFWGGTSLLFGIFGIIGLLRNEWTTFKIIIEFAIPWLIMMDNVNLIYLANPAHTVASYISEITDIIIIAALIVINTYAYLRENKL